MTTLRCAIHRWLEKIGWRRSSSSAVSYELARDLALPPEIVSAVLAQAIADLNDLARHDDAGDPTPILHKAISKLASHGGHSPFDEAALHRCLNEISEPHLTILRHYKRGMKQQEIAAQLGMDEDSVNRSLVRSYADLRMKMLGVRDDEERHTPMIRSPSHQPIKQSH